MRTFTFFSAHSALLLIASLTCAADHEHMEGAVFQPDQMEWRDGPKSLPPGAKMALLEGDLTREGPFVVRMRAPDGYKIPAHTHPATEHLTVIRGTVHLVMGDALDPQEAHTLPAGSFGYMPAGMKHYVWMEGETEVQVHGVGPWGITYLNPADDPRNTSP